VSAPRVKSEIRLGNKRELYLLQHLGFDLCFGQALLSFRSHRWLHQHSVRQCFSRSSPNPKSYRSLSLQGKFVSRVTNLFHSGIDRTHLQPRNLMFLAVYCWLPATQHHLPPRKTRSLTNPPEPFSWKIPTCLVSGVSGRKNSIFCNVHACETCQWMPTGNMD
jgi:hypothetical protein